MSRDWIIYFWNYNAFTTIIENYSFLTNWCETEVIQKLCNNTCVNIKVQNILNVYNKTGRYFTLSTRITLVWPAISIPTPRISPTALPNLLEAFSKCWGERTEETTSVLASLRPAAAELSSACSWPYGLSDAGNSCLSSAADAAWMLSMALSTARWPGSTLMQSFRDCTRQSMSSQLRMLNNHLKKGYK